MRCLRAPRTLGRRPGVPSEFQPRVSGKGRGRGGRGGKAYYVSESPVLFSLPMEEESGDETGAFCHMVGNVPEHDSEEDGEMQQDAGRTFYDDRRSEPSYTSGWDLVPPAP